jgi:hypothetical protein
MKSLFYSPLQRRLYVAILVLYYHPAFDFSFFPWLYSGYENGCVHSR